MRRIKGPNGLVFSFPDAVAEALLRHKDHVEVKDDPKPEKPAPKRARRTSEK